MTGQRETVGIKLAPTGQRCVFFIRNRPNNIFPGDDIHVARVHKFLCTLAGRQSCRRVVEIIRCFVPVTLAHKTSRKEVKKNKKQDEAVASQASLKKKDRMTTTGTCTNFLIERGVEVHNLSGWCVFFFLFFAKSQDKHLADGVCPSQKSERKIKILKLSPRAFRLMQLFLTNNGNLRKTHHGFRIFSWAVHGTIPIFRQLRKPHQNFNRSKSSKDSVSVYV